MRSRLRSVAVAALAFVFYSCSENSVTGPEFERAGTSASVVSQGPILISQIYGGGGNALATIKNDFIELFNTSSVAVSLAGWSVQYASSAGTTWQVTQLTGSIPANGYYLIQQAAGAGGTILLSPNATGTIGMSATAGKVVLVKNGVAPLSGACPVSTSILDQVSFGTAASDCGSRTTSTLTNTTAALRKDSGCQNTGDLFIDFTSGAPTPRNASSPTKTCITTPQPVVDRVSVSGAASTIEANGSSQFTATAYDASNNVIPNVAFTWSSSNAAAATVNNTGIATGVAEGDALIIATSANGKTGSASLHVNPGVPVVVTTLVINEMMGDPLRAPGGSSFGEWFEVHNYGAAAIDLNGWTINTAGQPSHTISSSLVVAPGGYAVLGRGVDITRNGGVVIDYNYFNGNASTTVFLDNVDFLSLKNASGAVVDSVRWTNAASMAKGATRALRDASADNANVDGTNWGFSTTPFGDGDLGTPKAANGTLSDTPPPVPNVITFTGRLASDPALPVGFEDQLFATEKKGTDNSIITTTFTWSSDTPGIATIDANGVMRGVSTGNAVFRATAADGTMGTIALPVLSLAPGSSAQYGNNTEFGIPTDGDASDDFIVTRPEFTASYSSVRNTPNWVAYNLEATHIAGAVDRCDCFTHDAQLPASFQVIKTSDYTGSGAVAGYGIDRGHLARSFDRTAAAYDNAQTYLLTNIIPQANAVNTGQWAQLENYLGSLATASNKELYIIAGVAGNIGTLKNEGKVVIPGKVWKIAVIMDRDKGLANVARASDLQILAVITDNTPAGNTDWRTWETTVDAIEALSGYDFLASLPNNIEAVVEGTTKAPTSEPAGPYTAVEGTPVAFNGSASTDPDGDALTYEWAYGDGSTGTGVNAPHAYADNGSFTAILTVTDPAGANDVTDTPVTITNAAPVVNAASGFIANAGQSYTLGASFIDAGANDSPWSYEIAWGDGAVSNGSTGTQGGFSANHTYATAGSYSVSLKVTDKDGGWGVSTVTGLVRAAPSAAVNGPYTSDEGSAVAMSGAASNDADGSIVSYAWNFGDGTTGTGASVSHTYANDGDYNVTMTVTDNDGLTGTVTTTARAANVGPAITKGLGQVLQSNGSYATTGSFADPGADSWTATVDYGDGSGATPLDLSGKSFSLSHTYAAGRSYTITVTVSDDDATSSDSYTVRVQAEPVSNAGGAYSSNEGSSVAITGAASSDIDGTITGYAWTFGDGGSATGANVSHTYAQNGNYTVTLVVTDNEGLTGTSTTTVNVANVGASISSFAGATLLPGEAYGATGSFADPGADSWNATVNYGDGSGSSALSLSGKNFSLAHTYNAAGIFTVTVTVNDGTSTSTQTQTVTVLTPLQGSSNALGVLDQLVADGKVSNADSKTLRNRLESAQKQIERDNANSNAAKAHLDGALKELERLVAGGKISAANAAELRSLIVRLLATT